jgi:hypothetical protein
MSYVHHSCWTLLMPFYLCYIDVRYGTQAFMALVSLFSAYTRKLASYLIFTEGIILLHLRLSYLFCLKTLSLTRKSLFWLHGFIPSSRYMYIWNSWLIIQKCFSCEGCRPTNSVALVRERTRQTERPPLFGEVNANFWGLERCRMASAADPLRPWSRFSRPGCKPTPWVK